MHSSHKSSSEFRIIWIGSVHYPFSCKVFSPEYRCGCHLWWCSSVLSSFSSSSIQISRQYTSIHVAYQHTTRLFSTTWDLDLALQPSNPALRCCLLLPGVLVCAPHFPPCQVAWGFVASARRHPQLCSPGMTHGACKLGVIANFSPSCAEKRTYGKTVFTWCQ